MKKPSPEFIKWWKDNDMGNLGDGCHVLKDGSLHCVTSIKITKENNPYLHSLFEKFNNAFNNIDPAL